jgi:hypothetical protein
MRTISSDKPRARWGRQSRRQKAAGLADLLLRVQRRRDRGRLVGKFWMLGPRFWIELLAHLDRGHGVGDEIEAAVRRALGLPPDIDPTPTAAGHQNLRALRRLAAHRLQQHQWAVALHRLGAAPLLAIIEALDSSAIAAAEIFMQRAIALPPAAICVAGADRLVPGPIRRVR